MMAGASTTGTKMMILYITASFTLEWSNTAKSMPRAVWTVNVTT